MLFNSFTFIFIFLPITVSAYWLAERLRGPRASTIVLGLFSYLFFVLNEPDYCYLLFLSVCFNFLAGMQIDRISGSRRTALLIAAIAIDLSVLFFFKYAHFATETFVDIGLLQHATPPMHLPAGISFFTFTQIAFLVDVNRRSTRETRFSSYFLFVTIYPHLIAGPILHHSEMIHQFDRKKRLSIRNHLIAGLMIFSIGLAKKTIVADSVAPAANAIFDLAASGGHPNLLEAWIGSLAYTLQIYFDFSGYCDMAIGLAKLMDIRLPINFNSPYKAVSIVDFWRRWHITLSRFLRDYVYIALGGNRKGNIRRYLNLLATMVLGGLWHGAAWTFIIWGAAHGVALTAAHAWHEILHRRLRWSIPVPVSRAATFALVVFLWVPFRANSIAAMFRVWRGMIGFGGLSLPNWEFLTQIGRHLGLRQSTMNFSRFDTLVICLALLLAWLAPNTQQIMARYRPGLDSKGYQSLPQPDRFSIRIAVTTVLLAAILFGLAIGAISPNSDFIYFRF